jgi:fucose permease
MRDVSAEGTYSRNLSFAQGFKGIGSAASSFIVGGTVLTSIAVLNNMGWRGVFPIFFVLMAIAFVWVLTLKIDETKADVPPSVGSPPLLIAFLFGPLGILFITIMNSILISARLLKKRVFALAVLGIFLYVGAEVCMARFLLPIMREMGIEESTASKFGPAFFFLMLTVGRLVGGAVLTLITPRTFFRISAALGLIGGLVLTLGNSSTAILGVLMAGLGFANIWPMLFSITVEEEPARGSELSGLMCMAISGGAIVPLVMGKLVDVDLGSKAFIVPVVCFAYLLVLSLKGESKMKKAC